jgi:hypothetical protein
MQHQSALLFGRLDLHKAHGRTSYRLADRLSVGSIVFVALDVGLHVFRRHQPHLVAKLREFTRPSSGLWRRPPCRPGTVAAPRKRPAPDRAGKLDRLIRRIVARHPRDGVVDVAASFLWHMQSIVESDRPERRDFLGAGVLCVQLLRQ